MNRCISTCRPLKERCEDCPANAPQFKIPFILWILALLSISSIVFRVVTKPDYAYEISIGEGVKK